MDSRLPMGAEPTFQDSQKIKLHELNNRVSHTNFRLLEPFDNEIFRLALLALHATTNYVGSKVHAAHRGIKTITLTMPIHLDQVHQRTDFLIVNVAALRRESHRFANLPF